MRAEEPLDDEPADPADGPRDLVGLGQKRALAVRLDLVRPDQRSGESSVGQTALRRWESHRPDVVLLDLGLPDMDGLQVIGRIRRDATTPPKPELR